MSNDQPPPDRPPEDDPFRKRPQDPTPPPSGSPYDSPPAGGAGGGGAGGDAGGFRPPPPPPGGGPGGPGDYSVPDPLAGMPPLADFGKRLAARIIDVLIVYVPLFVIQLATGAGRRYVVRTDEGEDATQVFTRAYSGSGLMWTLIVIFAFVAYDWLLTRNDGQTVGKKALGLRVAMLNDGTTPPSNAALGRAAMLWVPTLLPCCICLWPIALAISIAVDKPYQQGLHDKVAKTVVVVKV
ncbi:RDD family protein [Streptomyces bambusae]|uniref:RDD family protein n=1 Tax=Streptomyces bambusae TaxID=1550616 RepID=A0ABS6Z3C2_9ACTN|nr:RDD family protein [Streptomyces bambusae]MBW5482263.1 RDD family protein [Streptomyces bambusae]